MNARALVCARCQRAVVLWGIVTAFVLLAVPAWAATINVIGYETNQVSITFDGTLNDKAQAGEFHITVTDDSYGLTSFDTVAYCIELTQDLASGEMELEPLAFTATMEAQVAWLMYTYAPRYYGAGQTSQGSQEGSGLQLAIWKVVYGDLFSVNSSTGDTIKAFYTASIDALANASPVPNLTSNIKFAMNETDQDLVVYNINNVPVPASLLLLGSGLLALVGLGRRRAKDA